MKLSRAELTGRLARAVPRADLLLLVAIVALAVGLRVVWVLHSETRPAEGVDSYWYDSVARSVAEGNGIANPDDGTTPTALFPPGYPFVLGIAYKVFGSGLGTAHGLNIAVAATTVLATYAVGRLVLGRGAALLAASLMAVFPSQVIYTSLVMSDLLFTLLFVSTIGLLLLASRAPPRPTLLLMLAAGLLAGVSVLVRGQGLVLLAVVPVWWVLVKRPHVPAVPLAVFVYAMILAVLPWTFRNWQQLDSPVLVSTNMGWNAAIGHNEDADGDWMNPGLFFLSTLEYPYPKREVKFNEKGLRIAWDYARTNPAEEVTLSAKKVYHLWKGDADAVVLQELNVRDFLGSTERRLLTDTSNAFYFAALALALVGLAGSGWRVHGWRSLVLLMVLGWTAFHIIIFAEPRLHYPLSPLVSLSAAAGIIGAARSAVLRVWGPSSVRG